MKEEFIDKWKFDINYYNLFAGKTDEDIEKGDLDSVKLEQVLWIDKSECYKICKSNFCHKLDLIIMSKYPDNFSHLSISIFAYLLKFFFKIFFNSLFIEEGYICGIDFLFFIIKYNFRLYNK